MYDSNVVSRDDALLKNSADLFHIFYYRVHLLLISRRLLNTILGQRGELFVLKANGRQNNLF